MPALIRQSLPYLTAVILYAVLTIVIFSPIFFDNKELSQHDILMGVGGTQEVTNYKQEGINTYWTNSMFSGMPSYLISAHYPGDLLAYMQKAFSLFLTRPASLLFISLISFYILLVSVGVRPWLALPGGLAYGLSTFMMISIEAGHNSKVDAMAFAPLVIAGVILCFQKKYLWGFAVTAFGLAQQLRSGHLQITYYLLIILILYAIFKLVYTIKAGEKWQVLLKPSYLLIGAAGLALAANIGKIYDTYSYSKYSIRGKAELSPIDGSTEKSAGLDRDYAFSWSNGRTEGLTLLVPYFYGGASGESVSEDGPVGQALKKNGIPPQQIKQFISQVPTYWGDQPFTAGPIYLGVTVFLLLILGLFYAPEQYKWWLLCVVLLGLLFAMGKNLAWFNNLIFDYLPGYNKFRAVTMALFMVMIAVPLLGFIGLESLAAQANTKGMFSNKKLLYSIGGLLGLLLLLFMASLGFDFSAPVDERLAQYPDWLLAAIRNQRAALLKSDIVRSIILTLLAGSAIWYGSKNQQKLWLVPLVLTVLILFDLIGVNNRYLNKEDFKKNLKTQYFAPSPSDQKILADTDQHYRVFNLQNPWNDGKTSYYHKSIGGYHGAKLRRYQDLVDRLLTPEYQNFVTSIQTGSPDFEALSGLNMLNTKYFVAGPQKEAVIQNEENYGNAWPVKEIIRVNSADAEMAALQSSNTAEQAVVNVTQFNLPDNVGAAAGKIELTNYQPNKLDYTANLNSEGLVLFSEVYYPDGWKATINGEEVTTYRANYILRALHVPSGQHKITFEFTPAYRQLFKYIMLLAGLAILASLALAIFYSYRTKPTHRPALT